MDKRHERRAWRTLAADNTNVFDTGVFAEPLRDIINQGSLRGPWFSALWVDKTMSDTITLLCLVHGESSQHVFPIDITKNKLVGHLMQQIHKECHPRFEHVKAAELTLWLVSIPTNDDASFQSLVLNDQDNRIQKLSPTRKISKIFSEEPHVHIIVEPPKSAGKCKRSSVTLDNHYLGVC